jgi:teichuronic acid biosynthesis glycosyltransferase TuaG
MPYYKKDFFIDKTIESILNQSYQNIEILIIDDELNDQSSKVLKNLSNRDKRIKILFNQKNLGAGPSRNKGIEMASGEYIAFCDCDDLWSKFKLEDQLNFMKKFDIDFSFTAYQIIDKEGKIIGSRSAKDNISFDELILSCDIGLSTVMLKKKLFNNKNFYFPNIKTKEDYVVWLKLSQNGVKMKGIKKNYSYWRKLGNSLSSSPIQKIFDGYKVYNFYLNYSVIKSMFRLIILSINSILKK